jgi:hypothetical protein
MQVFENLVGRQFVVHIGKSNGFASTHPPHHRFLDLPPGDYYAQAVYNHALVMPFSRPGKNLAEHEDEATVPERAKGREAEILSRGPLLVSEPVKFTVTQALDSELQSQVEIPATHWPPVTAQLNLLTPKAKVGRWAEVELRLVNLSDKTIDLYSPVRTGRERASSLAILSEDGTLIGDLFAAGVGSAEGGWSELPPGGLRSTKFRFSAGLVWDTPFWNTDNMLPPGKYVLEWRIHNHLVSGLPVDLERGRQNAISYQRKLAGLPSVDQQPGSDNRFARMTLDEWKATLPGLEICRSNRVELEILPRTGD